MSFEFDGFDELMSQIEELENMSDDIQKAALHAGAEYLENEFKSNIYKRIGRDSGTAQRSITKSKINKNGEIHVAPTSDAFYLIFLENGFYNKRAGKFVPATPIFSPIFLQSRMGIMNAMIEAARNEMNKL